jgi:hypothetical protein
MALLFKLIKNTVKYTFLTVMFVLDTPETEASKNRRKKMEEDYYELLRDAYKIHTL